MAEPEEHSPDEPIDATEARQDVLRLSPRVKRVLQVTVVVMVPAALAWFVWDSWDDFARGPWDVRPGLLALSAFLYLVAEGIPPLGWDALMRAAGTRAPLANVYFVWFAVEPTKYLPIPIGPLVGRFALADRVGLAPVVAIVTLAYDFAIAIVSTVSIALPGFIWIGFVVKPDYWWVVVLTIFFLLVFLFSMLREGGMARTIADMLGTHGHQVAEVQVARRDLVRPTIVNLVAFAIRICAAGSLLAALTPVDAWAIPLVGLVFASSSVAFLGRFGTREAFIVVGLKALGYATGPVALAAVASRALGLCASLAWLGASALIGGGRRRDEPSAATPL